MRKRAKNPKPPERADNPEPVVEAAPPVAAPEPGAPVPNPELELVPPLAPNPRRRKRHGRKRRGGKKKSRRNPIVSWSKAAMITGAVLVTGALGYGIYRKAATNKSKTMTKCGDKYRSLIVTASGYDLENPGSDLPFAGQSVYAEWYELAEKLGQEARDRFAELGEIEKEAGEDSHYPRWNALVALNNRMNARIHDLTTPSLVVLDYAGARSAAQTAIFDAVCLMEKADEGIVAYGGNVPVTPTVTGETQGVPAWKWFALGGGVTIALGGIGYAMSRKSSGGGGGMPSRPSLPSARATRPE